MSAVRNEESPAEVEKGKLTGVWISMGGAGYKFDVSIPRAQSNFRLGTVPGRSSATGIVEEDIALRCQGWSAVDGGTIRGGA